MQNSGGDSGASYGYDCSLPSYLAPNCTVYAAVSDEGTKRIQTYLLYMHSGNRDEALARVRQELPSDATVAWDLKLDRCYRVAFISPTLEAAGHYMAEIDVEDLQEGVGLAHDPHSFNLANFSLATPGESPDPEIGC